MGQDLGVGPAPGLGLGPAGEGLQGPVHGRDPPVGVGEQDPVGDRVEHRLGLAGRPLGLLQAQGRLQGAGDLVSGQPEQGLLLAVELVVLGPAQRQQPQEAPPGQQRHQGQGGDPHPGHQVAQDREAGGHLVEVGHAHHLPRPQRAQGQDQAELGVGLDDVVGHRRVGEAGQGPQMKVAALPGGPEHGPGGPDLGPQALQHHLGQPLEAGRPHHLGRQVAQALQGLHAPGQPAAHGLEVAGHRPQLVVDPELDRGLQVPAGQAARGRAQGVGRRPHGPAQPDGQQDQGPQQHRSGPHGQGLGRLVGPVLAAGIGPLGPDQLVLEGDLAVPEPPEVAVGVAAGGHQGGRHRPVPLLGLQLAVPGPDPGPVLGGHLLDQRRQARPAPAQVADPVEAVLGVGLGVDVGPLGLLVAGEQVGAPACLHGHEVAAEPGGGPAQEVDPLHGRLQRGVGPGGVAGGQEDGRPPGHHQQPEQGEQDGELHPQAPHR